MGNHDVKTNVFLNTPNYSNYSKPEKKIYFQQRLKSLKAGALMLIPLIKKRLEITCQECHWIGN